MSSEILGGAQDVLKGNLGGAWDVKHGYADAYTDLGIARKFGGAAAAYSLRDIGAMNGPVVRVRRESDNAEADFSALAVPFIADWVNRQTVKPLDIQALNTGTGVRDGFFQIASAAYSLRSLGARQATVAATGDTVTAANGKYVVQVRRSKDNTIKSFTADEVSDGTLVNFVTEEQTKWTTQPTWSITGAGEGNILRSQSSTASTSTITFFAYGIDTTITDNSSPSHIIASAGDTITVNLTITNLSGAAGLQLRQAGGTTAVGSVNVNNGTANYTIAVSGDVGHFAFIDVGTTDGGDTFPDGTITFNSISVTGQNGFVRTWYDQSVTDQGGGTATGNHATQTTANQQPRVVIDGSLVVRATKPSMDFGGNDFLERETYTQGTLSQPNTFFSVAELDAYADENRKVYDSHLSGARNMLQLNTAGNGQFAHFAGTVRATGEDADADRHIFTSLLNGASSNLRIDGTNKNTNDASSQGMTGIVIGANHNVIENFWDGDIQELIVYNSDQTANMGAFEGNMADQYGITSVPTGANTVNGFVETWYDQIGSNDLVQSTANDQPKIVNSGSLFVNADGFGGIALGRFGSGINGQLDFTSGITISNSHSFQYVEFQRSFCATLISTTGGGSNRIGRLSGNNLQILRGGGQNFASGITLSNNPFLYTTFLAADGSASNVHINGVEKQNTTYGNETGNSTWVAIGRGDNDSAFPILISELILYSSEQSSRTAIEANINSKYSIF